jgi:lipoate-protein ligase A
LFEVERFRDEPRRLALAREVEKPMLVLGSTQRTDIVDRFEVHDRGIEVVRRHGGGGAVFLEPGNQLWVDAWIPRHDPLWQRDVLVAAAWVADWWRTALSRAGLGGDGLSAHAGRSEPGDLGDLICFAGRGPGEVFSSGRKVVGLSQWRSREGSLFSSCVYAVWDPAPLVRLLDIDEPGRARLLRELAPVAVGLAALGDRSSPASLGSIRDDLLSSIDSWPDTGFGSSGPGAPGRAGGSGPPHGPRDQ